ncbi:hypothetical protein T11_14324 [Trichinella zimbabwensis]|uniref:Uncharacterized protein n=1 Tax=Trichinella zimbabwensis TaxID=268475 RepID=A0A0V1G9S0_9BILA|nr:hypothetical protein T11_14324 [Trichinella zimbabwensis]
MLYLIKSKFGKEMAHFEKQHAKNTLPATLYLQHAS